MDLKRNLDRKGNLDQEENLNRQRNLDWEGNWDLEGTWIQRGTGTCGKPGSRGKLGPRGNLDPKGNLDQWDQWETVSPSPVPVKVYYERSHTILYNPFVPYPCLCSAQCEYTITSNSDTMSRKISNSSVSKFLNPLLLFNRSQKRTLRIDMNGYNKYHI